MKLPNWNLTNIYKSFDDAAYQGDIKDYTALCAELKAQLSKGKKEALEEAVQLLGQGFIGGRMEVGEVYGGFFQIDHSL